MHSLEVSVDNQSALLAQAIETINRRQYAPGDAFFARYSRSIRPLLPDIDFLLRRGVDLIALASALENGLDAKLVGQVLEYRTWCIDEFNLFNRAGVTTEMLNSAMRRFLDHPRNW